MNSLQKLLDFLNKLDEYGLAYTLEHNREESLSVLVSVPGERWEVEYQADGEVAVDVFYSGSEQDDLEGEEALERLFADYEEDEDEDEDDDYEEDDYDEDDEEDDDDLDEDEDDYEDEDEYEEDEEDEEAERRS